MQKTGKEFEKELRYSLNNDDMWWMRLQDTSDISRYIKHEKKSGKSVYNWDKSLAGKQPADFMAVYRSRPILIECKTTRNLTSFPLYNGSSRSIPKHQITLPSMAQKHGALAFILIRRDEYRNKRVFAITTEQADYLYKKKGVTRKSVPWKWFEENAFELERLKNPLRGNVKPLFEEYV